MNRKLLVILLFIFSTLSLAILNCGGDEYTQEDLFKKLLGNYILSGTVIDGRTELPIAGATVTISYNNYQTITDTNGMYKFTEIPEGTYTIHIKNNASATYAEVQITGVAFAPNAVAATQLVRMYENTGSVTGTVADLNTNAPINGATVRIYANGGTNFGAGTSKTGTTDANGAISLTGLVIDPAVTWTLKIEATDYNDYTYVVNTIQLTKNLLEFKLNNGNNILLTPILDSQPYVTAVTPAIGTAVDAASLAITLTFSEAMDTAQYDALYNTPGNLRISLQPKNFVSKAVTFNQNVKVSYAWDSAKTGLTITPADPLSPGVVYQIMVYNINSLKDAEKQTIRNNPANASNTLFTWGDPVVWHFEISNTGATADSTKVGLRWENYYNSPAAIGPNTYQTSQYNNNNTTQGIADVNNKFTTPIPNVRTTNYRLIFSHVANARKYELFRVEEGGVEVPLNLTDNCGGDMQYTNGEAGCENFTHVFRNGYGIDADNANTDLTYLTNGEVIVVNYVKVQKWIVKTDGSYAASWNLYITSADGSRQGPVSVEVNLGKVPDATAIVKAVDLPLTICTDHNYKADNNDNFTYQESGDNDCTLDYDEEQLFIILNKANFAQPSVVSNVLTGVAGFNVYVKKNEASADATDARKIPRGSEDWMLVNQEGPILNPQTHGDYIYLPLKLNANNNDFFELDQYFDDMNFTPFSNMNNPKIDIRIVGPTGLEGPSMYSDAAATAIVLKDTEAPQLTGQAQLYTLDNSNSITNQDNRNITALGLNNTNANYDDIFNYSTSIWDRRANYSNNSDITYYTEFTFTEYMEQKDASGNAILPTATFVNSGVVATANVPTFTITWVAYNKVRFSYTLKAGSDFRGCGITFGFPATLTDTSKNAMAARNLTYYFGGPIITGITGYVAYDSDNNNQTDQLSTRAASTFNSASSTTLGTHTAVDTADYDFLTITYTFSVAMDTTRTINFDYCANGTSTNLANNLNNYNNVSTAGCNAVDVQAKASWSTDSKTLTIVVRDNVGTDDTNGGATTPISNDTFSIDLSAMRSQWTTGAGNVNLIGDASPDLGTTYQNNDTITATIRID